MALDEAEAIFKRCAEPISASLAAKLVGTYVTPSGFKCQIVQKSMAQTNESQLYFAEPGQLDRLLNPYRALEFRSPSAANIVYRFTMVDDTVTGMIFKTPTGEYPLSKAGANTSN